MYVRFHLFADDQFESFTDKVLSRILLEASLCRQHKQVINHSFKQTRLGHQYG